MWKQLQEVFRIRKFLNQGKFKIPWWIHLKGEYSEKGDVTDDIPFLALWLVEASGPLSQESLKNIIIIFI